MWNTKSSKYEDILHFWFGSFCIPKFTYKLTLGLRLVTTSALGFSYRIIVVENENVETLAIILSFI